jgi:hypothetical protein
VTKCGNVRRLVSWWSTNVGNYGLGRIPSRGEERKIGDMTVGTIGEICSMRVERRWRRMPFSMEHDFGIASRLCHTD